ncbi:type III pantothenate kinase [Atopomonas sediminilitoris]|uniref:type III pantothenate kinase n=1 Tax=Atopomonas sediminilitoris TaxID=2919919 RepID=UPI001F4E7245|nr:type III pantothenate kinase [Atopomonas sediminilitoris]MCJ8170926.1 type III pantothenate kinase [Atopomonas sediminilitoris]
MILELDCGNSLIKWRLLRAGGRVAGGASYGADELLLALRDFEAPRAVRLVSVRSADETDALLAELQVLGQLPVQQAIAARSLAGVRNGYADYAQLGLDRWLTAVAAYAESKAPCLVVDLGTAITVDYVCGGGEHLGGFIAPGLQLMRSQLKLHTRRIRYDSVDTPMLEHAPADNTRDAVERGCLQMLQGFVLGLVAEAGRYLGDEYVVYLTGGDADLAACFLPQARLRPDLVFDGLALACPMEGAN